MSKIAALFLVKIILIIIFVLPQNVLAAEYDSACQAIGDGFTATQSACFSDKCGYNNSQVSCNCALPEVNGKVCCSKVNQSTTQVEYQCGNVTGTSGGFNTVPADETKRNLEYEKNQKPNNLAILMQERCWLQKPCENGSGMWGRSEAYKLKNNGLEDEWSLEVCEDIGTYKTARCFAIAPTVPLQIGIPGVTTKACVELDNNGNSVDCSSDENICTDQKLGKCQPAIKNGFPGYIQQFAKFFIGMLAVSAVVMVMWGGFKRIIAAGNEERISDSNDAIFGAIIGLVLALISYTLLNLLNPKLVENNLLLMEKVKPVSYGALCPTYEQDKRNYEAGWWEEKDGASIQTTLYSPNTARPTEDTCGVNLVLNGTQCVGQECMSGNGGCFPKEEGSGYECKKFLAQGKIGGVEVNYVAMSYICNDGSYSTSHCYLSSPGISGKGQNLDVEGKGSYTIGGCYRGQGVGVGEEFKPSYCSTGFKGMMLKVEVEGKGADDWYAIDASTCGSQNVKPIIQSNSDKPDDLKFADITENQLLNPYDDSGNMTKLLNCGLYLTRENGFKDR